MTGRTNDRTGAFRVGEAINKQEKMMSTAFRDAGYATAHFGKWHLNYSGVGLERSTTVGIAATWRDAHARQAQFDCGSGTATPRCADDQD